jgi:hypothetical protein
VKDLAGFVHAHHDTGIGPALLQAEVGVASAGEGEAVQGHQLFSGEAKIKEVQILLLGRYKAQV